MLIDVCINYPRIQDNMKIPTYKYKLSINLSSSEDLLSSVFMLLTGINEYKPCTAPPQNDI